MAYTKTPKSAQQRLDDQRRIQREYIKRRRANDPEWNAMRRRADYCTALAKSCNGNAQELELVVDAIRTKFAQYNTADAPDQGVNA